MGSASEYRMRRDRMQRLSARLVSRYDSAKESAAIIARLLLVKSRPEVTHERMKVVTAIDKQDLGRQRRDGAERIRGAIAQRGDANIIVATGASQFEILASLLDEPGIAWNRVTAFHLDEYVGLPISHPASFRKYLWERLHRKLPLPLAGFQYINGEAADPCGECQRIGELIRQHPIDVAFVGIGENGHLAFNDPPADFETEEPYLVVNLDAACRRSSSGKGGLRRSMTCRSRRSR